MAPCLAVRELTIDLPAGADRPHAVRSVSFEIAPGEVLCLVGESGSGKSVIAQAVMGLLPGTLAISAGRIELQGENLVGMPEGQLRKRRGTRIAMVFQEPMTALNPVMRCGAQVDEVLLEHTDMSAAERHQRVLEIFARVRLPDPERIYRAYPHELSGGQRQRIVIAIALILRPALLICDEPTTALDVTTQAEILALISELQRDSGTAVLFITHDFGVVADIADQVVVLQLGEQIESGRRDAVLRKPRQEYTRTLLGAVPRLAPVTRTTASDTLLLAANRISKDYRAGSWPGKRRVVRAAVDVSFRLHAGETIGIVGESGSGKSTTARCIAGLIEASAGELEIPALGAAGKPGGAQRGRQYRSRFRRFVQVIFQDPNRSLNPRRTVGESIIEGPTNFGVPRAEAWRRAEELMGLVRLQRDALRRYPSEFSGGQRQRLCIARALACEPKVLIADEAVSALDVSVQEQILELLDEIQQRTHIGMLFITHDLRVASQICDEIAVMYKGSVVEYGPPARIFRSPAHDYTRRLVSAIPGNEWAPAA